MTAAGTQLRLKGLDLAKSKFHPDLIRAKEIAKVLGMAGELVDADMVRAKFEEYYERPLKIGNAMGGIFECEFDKKKGNEWEFAGFRRSKRPQAHSRTIKTWRLKARQVYKPAPKPFEVGVENGVRFCLTCNQETEACTCPK